jgi:hypothetical protein
MVDRLLAELELSPDEEASVRDALLRIAAARTTTGRADFRRALTAYQDARVAGLCREGALELLLDALRRPA